MQQRWTSNMCADRWAVQWCCSDWRLRTVIHLSSRGARTAARGQTRLEVACVWHSCCAHLQRACALDVHRYVSKRDEREEGERGTGVALGTTLNGVKDMISHDDTVSGTNRHGLR
mmetsp:Transcript_130578/g.363866  ORF Transcript_130578/g.363866 Transcript_130578/m.363866 type:complete len:115 (-) Transcript_130578:29-373(-)